MAKSGAFFVFPSFAGTTTPNSKVIDHTVQLIAKFCRW
jgi:hypothetical protein